jgi:hypothetical protein
MHCRTHPPILSYPIILSSYPNLRKEGSKAGRQEGRKATLTKLALLFWLLYVCTVKVGYSCSAFNPSSSINIRLVTYTLPNLRNITLTLAAYIPYLYLILCCVSATLLLLLKKWACCAATPLLLRSSGAGRGRAGQGWEEYWA